MKNSESAGDHRLDTAAKAGHKKTNCFGNVSDTLLLHAPSQSTLNLEMKMPFTH